MMYICRKDKPDLHWHIGESVEDNLIHDIWMVQADGDELVYIETRFINLRNVRRTRVVRWYGDDAVFIVGNLR